MKRLVILKHVWSRNFEVTLIILELITITKLVATQSVNKTNKKYWIIINNVKISSDVKLIFSFCSHLSHMVKYLYQDQRHQSFAILENTIALKSSHTALPVFL